MFAGDDPAGSVAQEGRIGFQADHLADFAACGQDIGGRRGDAGDRSCPLEVPFDSRQPLGEILSHTVHQEGSAAVRLRESTALALQYQRCVENLFQIRYALERLSACPRGHSWL